MHIRLWLEKIGLRKTAYAHKKTGQEEKKPGEHSVLGFRHKQDLPGKSLTGGFVYGFGEVFPRSTKKGSCPNTCVDAGSGIWHPFNQYISK